MLYAAGSLLCFLTWQVNDFAITESHAKTENTGFVITDDKSSQIARPPIMMNENEFLQELANASPVESDNRPELIINSHPDPRVCPPCRKLSDDIERGVFAGWKIRYDNTWKPDTYPRIRFNLNGKWSQLPTHGYSQKIQQTLNETILPLAQKEVNVESAPTPASVEAPATVQAPKTATPVVQQPARTVYRKVSGFNRPMEINHLLDPNSPHAGKFQRAQLESMSDWQLIDLHNREHGRQTNYSAQFDR